MSHDMQLEKTTATINILLYSWPYLRALALTELRIYLVILTCKWPISSKTLLKKGSNVINSH